jgi:hypothetical protein
MPKRRPSFDGQLPEQPADLAADRLECRSPRRGSRRACIPARAREFLGRILTAAGDEDISVSDSRFIVYRWASHLAKAETDERTAAVGAELAVE